MFICVINLYFNDFMLIFQSEFKGRAGDNANPQKFFVVHNLTLLVQFMTVYQVHNHK